jgi:hypothetical protein
MRRLGEILLARGALSKDQLHSGLTACKRNGGRLGTWLVRLGHIDEATLLAALAEQSGCPAADARDLASAPAEVRSLLHPTFARRHAVVPFARHGRTLNVALANPNDLVLVDEITRMTGLAVRPHVATEATLAAALASPVTIPAPAATAPPPGPPTTATREWRQFWRLESSVEELAMALDTRPAPASARASSAFPSLQPLAARVALFSLHPGRVMAWAAHGPGIITEDFNTLMLPMDRPSVLLNLTKGADVHVGPLSETEGNVLLLGAMGLPRARDVVVAPIRVRNKVVAFVWLDQPGRDVATVPVSAVREAARLTGLALEAIVLRQKMRSAGRLTERRRSN